MSRNNPTTRGNDLSMSYLLFPVYLTKYFFSNCCVQYNACRECFVALKLQRTCCLSLAWLYILCIHSSRQKEGREDNRIFNQKKKKINAVLNHITKHLRRSHSWQTDQPSRRELFFLNAPFYYPGRKRAGSLGS